MYGWIGIDLDGTLASGYENQIGQPVPDILELAKELIASGFEVRIFTARASGKKWHIREVEEWCERHLGKRLAVTNAKDWDCRLIIDDRAISVATDEGRFRTEYEQKRVIVKLLSWEEDLRKKGECDETQG